MKRKYQEQDSMLTMREGLQDYYDANPSLLDASKFENETAAFFRSHDRIHVIFGCDTTIVDEAKADLWTLMGTDLGVRYFRYLVSPAVRDLYKDLKKKTTAEDKKRIAREFKTGWRRSIVSPVQIYRRTRRMKRKWPWENNDSFLDRPLKDIRQEFGIEIF